MYLVSQDSTLLKILLQFVQLVIPTSSPESKLLLVALVSELELLLVDLLLILPTLGKLTSPRIIQLCY